MTSKETMVQDLLGCTLHNEILSPNTNFMVSGHMIYIVCHAAKYSKCRRTTDKCVFYRSQENTIFTHS